MIYKFNEYSEEKRYPKSVSLDQLMSKRRTHKMVDFSEYERQRIGEILTNRNIKYSLSSDFLEIWSDGGFSRICEMRKHDDDWFTISNSNNFIPKYFICDQFEELETYLNVML